jgi:hypothetical protein
VAGGQALAVVAVQELTARPWAMPFPRPLGIILCRLGQEAPEPLAHPIPARMAIRLSLISLNRSEAAAGAAFRHRPALETMEDRVEAVRAPLPRAEAAHQARARWAEAALPTWEVAAVVRAARAETRRARPGAREALANRIPFLGQSFVMPVVVAGVGLPRAARQRAAAGRARRLQARPWPAPTDVVAAEAGELRAISEAVEELG